MKRLLAILVVATGCIAVHGVASNVHARALPPCVEGAYQPGDAGTRCAITSENSPTARCLDGSFDYSRTMSACAGHGGVLFWLPPPGTPVAGTLTAVVHTWYTSSNPATFYYCDDDPLRLVNDLLQYQQPFSSVAALLAAYPGRQLHQPCLVDNATGP